MRLTDKTPLWGMGNKTFVGKRKGFNADINYVCYDLKPTEPYWFYTIWEGKFAYNSLWDNLKFDTKEECVAECEKRIDLELKKQKT